MKKIIPNFKGSEPRLIRQCSYGTSPYGSLEVDTVNRYQELFECLKINSILRENESNVIFFGTIRQWVALTIETKCFEKGGQGNVFKGRLVSSEVSALDVAVKCQPIENAEKEFLSTSNPGSDFISRHITHIPIRKGLSLSVSPLGITALSKLRFEVLQKGDKQIRELFFTSILCQIIDALSDYSKSTYDVEGKLNFHTDLKPSNIILIKESVQGKLEYKIKIIDFSSAVYGDQKKWGGTPGYLSPVLIETRKYTEYTELFVIAATVLKLKTGKPLYRVTKQEDVKDKGFVKRANEEIKESLKAIDQSSILEVELSKILLNTDDAIKTIEELKRKAEEWYKKALDGLAIGSGIECIQECWKNILGNINLSRL